jgi:thiol-disulfide isomerase/thioredoxin
LLKQAGKFLICKFTKIKMMKYLFSHLLVFFTLILNAQSNTSAVIEGNLEGSNNEYIYLTNKDVAIGGSYVLKIYDSTLVRNGYFKFVLTDFDETIPYAIEFLKNDWKPLYIYAGEHIQIQGNADSIWKAKIYGSRQLKIKEDMRSQMIPVENLLNNSWKNVMSYEEAKDTLTADYFRALNSKISDSLFDLRLELCKKYPDDIIALSYLSDGATNDFNKSKIKEILPLFSDRIKKSDMFKNFYKRVYTATVKVTGTAPVITGKNEADETIQIDSVKKITILDFWASWCVPCIEGIPEMKNIYDKYKDKIEIISLSIDKEKEKWLQSLQKLSMPWLQLNLPKGADDITAIGYNIFVIPKYYIIGEDNKTLLKSSSVEEVKIFLDDMFKNVL